MRISRFSLFATLLLVTVMMGCSSKTLNNSTAEEKIKSSFHDKQYYIYSEIGRIGTDCGTKTVEGIEVNVGSKPEGPEISAMAAGYITVEPDGANFRKVTLTEQGKAAANSEPYEEYVQKGCDYKHIVFPVANRELVQIEGITADENDPEVEYLWRWKVTKLGEALRQDGAAYKTLTPEQRSAMESLEISTTGSFGNFPLPIPPEGSILRSTVRFKRFTDGWRMQ
jgi:hypothetical protein